MENFGKSVNELVVDDAVEEIKAEMRSHGFEYDDINSDPEGGYIVFDTDGGTFPSGGFGSWDEVREWLDGMVFDESSTEIVQESQKGFVVADSNGNVISFKNGHRSFAPLGDNAVIYFNRDAAEKALYVFSDHCGIQGLSIKMIDGDGNILDCVDESDGDDSEKSELRKAFDYNKDKFMKKTGGKATLNKGVRKGLIQSVKHGVKVGRKFADKKVGAKVHLHLRSW